LLNDRFARLARQLRNLDLPAGMTPERLSAMAVVISDGPVSVTDLAKREFVRPATMSRMVSALVGDGHVRRIDDKTDGRGVLVAATARGQRLYHRAQKQRVTELKNALARLPSEQLAALRTLGDALTELGHILEN